jgi:hypothetical protein
MITKDQIKLSDAHAGVTASGSPVIYILSKGGLHMFLTQVAGQVEALAAAPHIGIARFFAEKKAGGINWSPDYIMKSEKLQSDYLEIRKSFFNKEIMAEDETYAIYDHKAKVIDIMDKEDFESTLKKGDITPFSFVRRIDIESIVKIIGTK